MSTPVILAERSDSLSVIDEVESEMCSRTFWTGVRRRVATIALALAIVCGGFISVSGSAEAVSANCGGGRCTVYLSKAETQAFGSGRIIPPPAWVPWQIKTAYYAAAYGHVWIAKQYANRGWCSGFRLSIYPWETQGYFGYPC